MSRFEFGRRQFLVLSFSLLLLACAGTAMTAYLWNKFSQRPVQDEGGIATLEHSLAAKLSDLEAARQQVDLHLSALALRLGQMQAQMIRLNALGQRLTEMAGIDQGEFNFDELPARGGPADQSQPAFASASEFLQDLEQLSIELTDRERQLTVIDTLLMNRNVNIQMFPAGRPVANGWVSSHYGSRINPFNGRREFHGGIDFAGKRGTQVIAVAAGVVIRSERLDGLGNLVEIDHGNGYVTRYAHNDRNVVLRGELVKKGQRIAAMGSTGHSTGTHVHFEIVQDGKTVNPNQYIKAGG